MSIEFKALLCDICKERPMKKTQKVKDEWLGVCMECMEERKEGNHEGNKT